MDDQQIIALYLARNEDALNQTAIKYSSYLTKISWQILANLEDSEECVNDTYLAAWNSIPPHKPTVLSTYLRKIVRQISIDLYRKRHSAKRLPSEYALSLSELGDCFSDQATPEQTVDALLLGEAISRFLLTLSPDARVSFVRRYYFFDSLKEISAGSSMSVPKIKSLLFRTRNSLKLYLEKEGFEI